MTFAFVLHLQNTIQTLLKNMYLVNLPGLKICVFECMRRVLGCEVHRNDETQ